MLKTLVVPMLPIKRHARVILIGPAMLLSISTAALAQPFDPVIELFRLSQIEHLVIDRGGPVARAGDVNGDGLDDVVLGSGIGGVRVVFGPTNGDAGRVNVAGLDGSNGFVIVHDNQNISVLAGIGDINSDGIDDVAVGSAAHTMVVFGTGTGFARDIAPEDLDGGNGFMFDSPATSISAAGDVNGDGVDDFIVGNANASPGTSTGAGITYVIQGSSRPFAERLTPASLDGNNGFSVLGGFEQDRTGYAVGAAGDFNNDGVDDFMIGAPNKTQGGNAEAGEAYLVYGIDGGFPAAISLSSINGGNGLRFRGRGIQDYVGASVSGVGDVNHDGIADVAIGSPSKGPFGSPNDYPGEAYVLFGGKHGDQASVEEIDLNGLNGFTVRGIRGGVVPIQDGRTIWGDMAGQSVGRAGDINDDGIDDLIIGASHAILSPSRKGSGQVYLVYGRQTDFAPRINLSELNGANGFRINGIGTVDYFGFSVSTAGDFNADSISDVFIGASGEGVSYVLYGRDTGVGQTAPASAPLNPSAVSSGFTALGYLPGTDAPALAFNELADPTGPNPLPEGTPTMLGDPSTPGNIPAVVNAIPTPTTGPQPITPEPAPEQTPFAPAESTGSGVPIDTAMTDEADEPVGSESSTTQPPAIQVGRSGGATSWFMLAVLAMALAVAVGRRSMKLS